MNPYRISSSNKASIAENLIGIMQNNIGITDETIRFISNWIVTGRTEKTKAFYDVWDIVLRNYIPTPDNRPILFRRLNRIPKKKYIGSFTGSVDALSLFTQKAKFRGYILILDTSETLKHEEYVLKHHGAYQNTFYPLSKVLHLAKEKNWGFSERFLDKYTEEHEYIMRVNPDADTYFKCVRNPNQEAVYSLLNI